MRLVTWNLNGIRAAIRKGLDDFVERINPDILLLQEVRALPEQLPKDWTSPMPHTLMPVSYTHLTLPTILLV